MEQLHSQFIQLISILFVIKYTFVIAATAMLILFDERE